jgi:hypothetical protein
MRERSARHDALTQEFYLWGNMASYQTWQQAVEAVMTRPGVTLSYEELYRRGRKTFDGKGKEWTRKWLQEEVAPMLATYVGRTDNWSERVGLVYEVFRLAVNLVGWTAEDLRNFSAGCTGQNLRDVKIDSLYHEGNAEQA